MKLLYLCCIVLLATGLAVANAKMDIRAPEQPAPSIKPGKVALHSNLAVVPDPKANEARLQISQSTLNELRAGVGGSSNAPLAAAVIGQSHTRTIVAGLLMFFAISIAGVFIARKARSFGRAKQAVVAFVFFVGVLGATSAITHGNAPPGFYRWRNLPQSLTEGRTTAGGVDVEIVPDSEMSGLQFRLIVPIKETVRAE